MAHPRSAMRWYPKLIHSLKLGFLRSGIAPLNLPANTDVECQTAIASRLAPIGDLQWVQNWHPRNGNRSLQPW